MQFPLFPACLQMCNSTIAALSTLHTVTGDRRRTLYAQELSKWTDSSRYYHRQQKQQGVGEKKMEGGERCSERTAERSRGWLSAVGVMKKGKVRGPMITHRKRGGSGTKGKMRGTDSEGSIGQLMDWLFPSELWRVNRLSFA